MQSAFWLQKWQEGKTGFHRDTPLPLLMKHWPNLSLPVGARVLVPLCGKSPDLAWLHAQGLRVLGVELSPLAVTQFFREHDLSPEIHATAAGIHHRAGNIEIIQGDIFDLDDATLASCDAVYDRAAIIALPPPLRRRYVAEVYARLPVRCQGLLVTLEYSQEEMDGPPFSVDAGMLDELLCAAWRIERLDHRAILDSEPGFRHRGLTALHTGVYRLRHRTDSA